ncbi:MAG: hypothetical protein Q7S27_02905 [Nanoarchaeota archaeon]|nr:hypothetical protein [Nanoarchaeota archaeon]
MKKELLNFIKENKLSPFNRVKTPLKIEGESIYKTKDAKIIHNKVISTLSSGFHFSDTSNLFNFFDFSGSIEVVKKRQDFFGEINAKINGDFLGKINFPKKWWNPKYGIVAVTEDEKTFNELKKIGCPTKFLITQNDLDYLEDYDIVQVVDCENFSRALENLPQVVFINSIDEVYLERYLQQLSGWKDNINVLKENKISSEIDEIINELDELLELLDDGNNKLIKREDAEVSLIKINNEISIEIKSLTVSGELLFTMLSKSTMPDELMNVVKKAIINSGMPGNIYTKSIPVEIDEMELEELINKQNTKEHTGIAENIKKSADKLRKVPEKLERLSDLILLADFICGISNYITLAKEYPVEGEELLIENSSNLFLENAQPISFYLNDNEKCSILTGANSGGKTTLLEHIIQLVSLLHIGFPTFGNVKLPLFSEIYYFAKNKGSLNKGAFETLLLQMSKIKSGKKTLILADEIESVTEPGVAGSIVCATADFFIKKGCYLVIATHLGKEIQKNLPKYARVDGIEAKGLDDRYELIVDHNPVIGRLANSTPELIVKKMANSYKTDYFEFLYNFLNKEDKGSAK